MSVSCDEGASRRVPVNKLERVTHLMARMMLGLQRGRGPGVLNGDEQAKLQNGLGQRLEDYLQALEKRE